LNNVKRQTKNSQNIDYILRSYPLPTKVPLAMYRAPNSTEVGIDVQP